MDEEVIAALTVTPEMAGIVVALIAAIPSVIFYKKSMKVDERTAQAGMATQETVTTGQVMQAFNDLVQRLQDDNEQLRDQVVSLLTQQDAFRAEIHVLEEKLDDHKALIFELKTEIADLLRRNGFSK